MASLFIENAKQTSIEGKETIKFSRGNFCHCSHNQHLYFGFMEFTIWVLFHCVVNTIIKKFGEQDNVRISSRLESGPRRDETLIVLLETDLWPFWQKKGLEASVPKICWTNPIFQFFLGIVFWVQFSYFEHFILIFILFLSFLFGGLWVELFSGVDSIKSLDFCGGFKLT